MSYIALYRKYRPKCFNDVLGQDIVVNILKNSIVENKINHAYIFSGTKGTGKTSVAKIFAKAINCINPQNGDICNECEICSKINENPIDIIEIDAASNNGINEIREIKNNSNILPVFCKYKVYIIDEAHMLSQSAFNALLKTLEEPPKHVIFILATTELNKIPSTVLSRCQKIDFKKISSKKIFEHLKNICVLENKVIDEDILNLISINSDGAFRDALNMLDQIFSYNQKQISLSDACKILSIYEDSEINSFVHYIFTSNVSEGIKKIASYESEGLNIVNFIDRVNTLITNILIYNTTVNFFEKSYEKVLAEFDNKNINKLFEISKIYNELNDFIKKSTSQYNLFKQYFIKSCFITKEFKQEIINLNVISNKESNKQNIDEKYETEDISNRKRIIINNCFFEASKDDKNIFNEKIKQIDKYLSNIEYTSAIKTIKKGQVEVVGKKFILFSFENVVDTIFFNRNLFLMERLLEKITNVKYNIIGLSKDEWIEEKNKYITNVKNGITYKYIDLNNEKIDEKSKINQIFDMNIVEEV